MILEAIALLGVIAIKIVTIQEGEAGCEKGRGGRLAFSQSKTRCLDRRTIWCWSETVANPFFLLLLHI
jgi:hypothetical protein